MVENGNFDGTPSVKYGLEYDIKALETVIEMLKDEE